MRPGRQVREWRWNLMHALHILIISLMWIIGEAPIESPIRYLEAIYHVIGFGRYTNSLHIKILYLNIPSGSSTVKTPSPVTGNRT